MSLRAKLLSFLALLCLLLITAFSYFIETVIRINPGMTELRPALGHLTAWLILAVIVLSGVLLVAFDLFVNIHLVRRLKQLGDALSGVKDARELHPFGFNKRYPDELSQVADEVAAMMERMRHSDELHRASETQFKTLFDSIPQAMVLREYLRNEAGEPTEYRIIDMNPAYADLMGVNREASVGRLRSEVFKHVTTNDWVLPLLPEVLRGRPQFLRRYSHLVDKHMQISVHSFGRDTVTVAFTDVTDRVKQSQELEARNRGLHDMLMAAEKLLDVPMAGLDYDFIVRESRQLFGAAGVVLSMARRDIRRLETVAVDADAQGLQAMEQMFGLNLVGSTWEWHIDQGDLEMARVLSYTRLADVLQGQIEPQLAADLQQRLSLGDFHILELSHRSLALGNLLICMPSGAKPLDRDVLTVFTRMLSAVLLRGQAEDALHDSETQYRALIEAAPVSILVTDLEGNIAMANEQAASLHGYASSQAMIGVNTMSLVHEDDRVLVGRQMSERRDGRVQRQLERRLLRLDGSCFYAEVTARAIMTAAGQAVGQLLISQDITSRKHAEDKLVYLSMHDQLTGLYNRAFFEEELHRLQDGRRFPVSIIAVDVNGLKLVNDTFGHATGDSLLKAAAHALKRALRQSDTLARVGGDEFALSLPNADAAVARSVLGRIRAAVEEHNAGPEFCVHCNESTWIPLSLSLGAATAVETTQNLEELFEEADTAMYRDKQAQGAEFADRLVQSLRDGRFPLRSTNYTSQPGEKASVEQLIKAIKDRGSR